MGRKIIVTPSQYRKINESKRKTLIINESQLELIREYENNKIFHHDFEAKIKKYMNELMHNPCKPKYDIFFKEQNIPENVLQKKMIDLGIITKKIDKIDEPEDENGKKHSVHSRKYIFSSKDFNDKIDKLYNEFFKGGERILNETDCGGAMGGDGVGAFDAPSADGATNAQGVGGTYTLPFGMVQRRNIGVSGSTTASMDKQSNIDMKPTANRKKGGIAVSRIS